MDICSFTALSNHLSFLSAAAEKGVVSCRDPILRSFDLELKVDIYENNKKRL